jgi:hypothetical protein
MVAVTLAATMSLTACTTPPSSIAPKYVDPKLYSNASCDDLTAAYRRVDSDLTATTSAQQANASTDTAVVAASVLLLPVGLIALAATTDRKDQIAELKGKHEALTDAMIAKKCPMTVL